MRFRRRHSDPVTFREAGGSRPIRQQLPRTKYQINTDKVIGHCFAKTTHWFQNIQRGKTVGLPNEWAIILQRAYGSPATWNLFNNVSCNLYSS